MQDYRHTCPRVSQTPLAAAAVMTCYFLSLSYFMSISRTLRWSHGSMKLRRTLAKYCTKTLLHKSSSHSNYIFIF